MKRVVIVVVAVGVALSAAAAAGAHTFTIRGDSRIGDFLVKRDGTLGGAIDAFGQPGNRDRTGEICTVRWPRHGLKITFYNSACGNRAHLRVLLVGTRARLALGDEVVSAIGDHQYRLRNLYQTPSIPTSRGWWLVVRRSPFGTGGRYPGLRAKMDDNESAPSACSTRRAATRRSPSRGQCRLLRRRRRRSF